MKKILRNITILVSFVAFYTHAFADIDASITLVPKFPSPNSVVKLTLESYSFNVNTAMISWKEGDKTLLEGQGESTLSVRTGNVGDSSTITVTATTDDGSSITQAINITPSSVSLIYEAPESYVPLLYEGRSLPGKGAVVKVTALPSITDGGRLLAPGSLSYAWYINDTFYKSSSGIGKQSATFNLETLTDNTTVKVLVSTPGGNTGQKTITIYPHTVMPLLYKFDQVLGPNYSELIGRRLEATESFSILLEPFYASDNKKNPLTTSWFLDGLPTTPFGGRLLSLMPKENSYGTRKLTISTTGAYRYVQKAETSVELIFDTRK